MGPAAVLAVLTDFGPRRARVWPNIDDRHFRVHDQGPGWADVTEGSSVAGGVWEREKYAWNASAGSVTAETIDSNTWGSGSRWDYKLSCVIANANTPSLKAASKVRISDS